MESWQTAFNIIGGAIVSACAWWLRKTWERIDKNELKIHDIEVDLPRYYQRKDELETRFDKLEKRFDRLDDHITALFNRIELRN